ncbi:MAG: DUF177 domain-containing protein [Hyphomicrobiaceae bacterium]
MTILPWTHAIADMPAKSRDYTREASLNEMAAMATDLGLLGCSKLHAQYAIRAIGGGRYKLTGTLDATVTQACVITLEPIVSTLKLPVDVEFSPDATNASPRKSSGDEGEDVEVSSLPDVEPIENASLDVGRVVFETLAAGIDPFPKKPDAAFAWDDPRAADPKSNPFAVLANLKPKQ